MKRFILVAAQIWIATSAFAQISFRLESQNPGGMPSEVTIQEVDSDKPLDLIAVLHGAIEKNPKQQITIIDDTRKINSANAPELLNNPYLSVVRSNFAGTLKAVKEIAEIESHNPELDPTIRDEIQEKLAADKVEKFSSQKKTTIIKASFVGIGQCIFVFSSWFDGHIIPAVIAGAWAASLGAVHQWNIPGIINDFNLIADKILPRRFAVETSGPSSRYASPVSKSVKNIVASLPAGVPYGISYYLANFAVIWGLSSYWVPHKLLGMINEMGVGHFNALSLTIITGTLIRKAMLAGPRELTTDTMPNSALRWLTNRDWIPLQGAARNTIISWGAMVIGTLSTAAVVASSVTHTDITSLKVTMTWLPWLGACVLTVGEFLQPYYVKALVDKIKTGIKNWRLNSSELDDFLVSIEKTLRESDEVQAVMATLKKAAEFLRSKKTVETSEVNTATTAAPPANCLLVLKMTKKQYFIFRGR